MEHSIYEFPNIFRRVHMEEPREIAQEVRFLRRIWRKHLDRPVNRVLDLACGNSPHGQLLARAGIEVVGIDRSKTMIAAGCRETAGLEGIRFYRRPIERFRLAERRFDTAFFMSETFPIMTENHDIVSHLRSVGRLLKRGALYCIDVDRQDGIRATRAQIMGPVTAGRRCEGGGAGGASPDAVVFRRLLQFRNLVFDSIPRAAGQYPRRGSDSLHAALHAGVAGSGIADV
jgi:SAM-dependent methyltransferase